MDELTIKCNWQWRLCLNWDQLTPKEQKEFDYLSEDDRQGRDFVRYRGWVYDLGEFMRANSAFGEMWDGYRDDSFFSGVLIRYNPEDSDRVMLATYFS